MMPCTVKFLFVPSRQRSNHYFIGVQIKSSFHLLARKYHPDKNRQSENCDNGEKFKRIRSAYEILCDPENRARFDCGESLLPTSGATITEVDLGIFRQYFLSRYVSLPRHTIRRYATGPDLWVVRLPLQVASRALTSTNSHHAARCRCSGRYEITHAQLEEGYDTICCGSCSLFIRVLYDVVEEQP